MKLRQSPYWLDRVPPRRRPSFPRLRTSLQTRVVIVGGGLTGVACAWSLSAARIPVVLLEKDRVGGAATAGTVGLVREDFDGLFSETVRLHGLRQRPHALAGDAPRVARVSRRAPAPRRTCGACAAAAPGYCARRPRGRDGDPSRLRREARGRAGSPVAHAVKPPARDAGRRYGRDQDGSLRCWIPIGPASRCSTPPSRKARTSTNDPKSCAFGREAGRWR